METRLPEMHSKRCTSASGREEQLFPSAFRELPRSLDCLFGIVGRCTTTP